ncbi:MAG: hypothetical protein JO077_20455 [Verrucomicrobia bacterium]|nr:hypothetical protein [Verrucomicrobiota bacterium]
MPVNTLRRFVVHFPKKDVEARRSDLGSLCETMRTHIASIVLACAVLTATSFLAPVARATDYLMPKTNGVWPFDPNPDAPGSLTRQFMTYYKDSDGNKIPVKTLRISNNTTQTVYPVMRDPNDAVIAKGSSIGLYDPYDAVLNEFRGYIGYQGADGKFYFGLKAGQSILVSVPLVFWNGGRIGIGTDGAYLVPMTKNGLPNPLHWDANSQRSITSTESIGDTIKNGVVMWYRSATPEGPSDDTEDQLAEFTIRDHDYLVNPKISEKTEGKIPFNQLVTLINYDVSNVDNIYLPLGFAANDVWVLPQIGPTDKRTDWTAGSDPDAYGWTGATNTIDFLQTKIQAFTDGNQLLGQYFGTNGWPYYNIPNPSNVSDAPRKIPGGANIFAESPLKGVLSSYNDGINWQTNKYMLSSGGTVPVSATIGWAGGKPDLPPSTTLHVLLDTDKLAFIHKGYLVTGNPPGNPPTQANPIQPGTTVIEPIDRTNGTVTLSKPLVASTEACSFTFTRPLDDYASDAMIKLWYSWAQYYLTHWKDNTPSAPTDPTTILASIDQETATLKFNEAHPELVEGMAVTGPGLDDAQTEVGKHQGDAVILEIASDKKSVILSQVVAKGEGSTNQPFGFLPPEKNPLLWTPTANGDPGYPVIVFDKSKFSGEPAWHDPYEFSQQVYLIMASMNQIGEPNNNNVSKYMQDIVGANMGYIFTDALKKTYDADEVTSMIRDKIKSVLRGVTDFTKFPDVIENGQHTVWYPNPGEEHGGQVFNVFNLDPFVRFVHVVLGFTGYGFSVDDDTADVGAGGASQLQLSVTGTGGLIQTAPWTIQAPYGPVGPVELTYSGPASTTNGDTLYNAIASVSNTTPITVTTVAPHRLSNGDTVRIDQVMGDNAANGTFTIGDVTRNTFALYVYPAGKSPVAPTGDYTGGGRWSYPLHAYIDTTDATPPDLTKVFYRVTGDDALGTFLGTFVSVNGLDKPPGKNAVMFRVWQLGQQSTGRLLLWADLTDQYGTPLAKGTYKFTFFGVVPTKMPNAPEQ